MAAITNWSAQFKDAAGDVIFTTGGHENVMTTDIKTGDTFLNKALVEMARKDQKAVMTCEPPLMYQWEKVSINAQEFGITGFTKSRNAVPDVHLQWAIDEASPNPNG